MNTQDFHRALKEVRNGADYFMRHPLTPRSLISSGLREVADTGCWWLVDLLCTGYAHQLKLDDKAGRISGTPIVEVKTRGGVTRVALSYGDDEPPTHKNKIDPSCLPDGGFSILGGVEDGQAMFYLLSEY